MRPGRVAAVVFLFISLEAVGQSNYSTGFENPDFTLGDVNGQNGWGHLGNSPTGGAIEPAPPGPPAGLGAQSLSIRTRDVALFGVQNHLYSATLNPGAGETGSTAGGVVQPAPHSLFEASFWFHTPSTPVISTRGDGVFAELNAASKGYAAGDVANRYVRVRLINTTNTAAGPVRVQMAWFTGTGTLLTANVADLAWGTWYRFDYSIQLVDGLAGIEPNDVFRLTVSDATGTQIGTACGSTWEAGWKSGAFGGGTSPRMVNGFDFWSLTGPNTTLVGTIDGFTMNASSPVITAPAVTISGTANVCAAGTTTLSAMASGGTAPFTSYIWRDASNAVVGSGATHAAGAGTYTVTITDSACGTATSPPFTVTEFAPLAATITGNTSVCFGGTTTLSASVSGGSGAVIAYEWRDAANAIAGTSPSLTAGAGTYTVTVTDASCGSVTSAPVTVQT
ncbi:MAG TPA: hypothetical protein VFT12_14230, partial [Thermoanaerobaculia bacterium]|nr:hypothetical protein [Thermoanaerobaculia bacterium]